MKNSLGSEDIDLSLDSACDRVNNMAQGFYFLEKLKKGRRISRWEIGYYGKRFINNMRRYYTKINHLSKQEKA